MTPFTSSIDEEHGKTNERKVARARPILGQKIAEKPAGEDSRSGPRKQSPVPQTEKDHGEAA